ncbi:MAG: pentapeptide repeat-containing protein [Planctomycetes bacterium]|nr:pentapeptide repeat-containing protein [Planctomycetota bacterium]
MPSDIEQNGAGLLESWNERLARSPLFGIAEKFSRPGVFLGIVVAGAALLIDHSYRNEEKKRQAWNVLGAVALKGESNFPMNPMEVVQAFEFLVREGENLGRVDLGRIRLSGLILPPETNLRNVRMDGGRNDDKGDYAELLNSTLRHVDFSNANLYRIHFSGKVTDLTGAMFKGAKMGSAVFTEASIDGADFCDAQLQNADFSHAKGINSVFSHAALEGAIFYEAVLPNAQFDTANLTKANLFLAHLPNANFNSADLTDAVFSDAILTNATFRDAHLNGAVLDGADLKRVELEGAWVDAPDWLDRNGVDTGLWEIRATRDDNGNDGFRLHRRPQDPE